MKVFSVICLICSIAASGCGDDAVVPVEETDPLVVDGLIPDERSYATGCSARIQDPDDPDENIWLDSISQTGCIDMDASPEPVAVDGALNYGVNSPLYSDGADKTRALVLPPDGQITFDATDAWEMPEGTHLLKFFYLEDQLIETRILVLEGSTWEGASYRWEDDYSEAVFVPEATLENIGGQDWLYPSETECALCHTRASGQVLGLRTEQMFRASDMFGLGSVNQVAALDALGYFTSEVDFDTEIGSPLVDHRQAGHSLNTRARSYLASNCANCHQPGGSSHSELDVRSAIALGETRLCEIAEGDSFGLPGGSRVIEPGNSGASVLVERMELLGLGQMPPLARYSIDDVGLDLLSDWIDSLDSCE